MFSSTELFPLDCDPTTAICGKSIGFWTCVNDNVRLQACNYDSGPHNEAGTYTNCCKDVLQLIDQCDELRIINIDPMCIVSLGRSIWT